MDVDEDGEMLDHRQMREALTSVVSCSVASTAVRKAFVKVCNISEVPVVVTRAELMEGLVRDMRFMKSSQYKKKADDVPDNYIPDGEYRRDIYPSPYTRDYKEDGLRNILLRVKPTLPDFDRVRAIDLTGQLILGPDERLIELTENLRGCPVEVLSLGNNGITDIGLKQFAKICRSLRNLHTLHLNHNKFTDDGIEALFHADNFAPSMRTLNIAFNRIGKGSGWAIGRMFTPGMDAKVMCSMRFLAGSWLTQLHVILLLIVLCKVGRAQCGWAGERCSASNVFIYLTTFCSTTTNTLQTLSLWPSCRIYCTPEPEH